MANTYQMGYGAYSDKFDMLEADIGRRFNIFNTVVANKFLLQDELINKYVNKTNDNVNIINTLQNDIKILYWESHLPWYKKLYYKLANKDLKQIYNEQHV